MYQTIKDSTRTLLHKHYHNRSKKGKAAVLTTLLGSLSVFSILVVMNSQSFSSRVASQAKNSERKYSQEKVIHKRENYEASAAKHFRRHSKRVEDPKYPLGHCNPQEAPREMDMKSNISKSPKDWSPC